MKGERSKIEVAVRDLPYFARRAQLSSRYQFVTLWDLDAPIECVWQAISQPDEWPLWWRGVEAVELLQPGDAEGVGAYRRFTWRSVLPYTLTFNMLTTKIEKPNVIEGVAEGELSGFGRWDLRSAGARTTVRYQWRVEATKPWMRWLAPVARPVFKWNHDAVMRWGFAGLQRRLGL